MPLVYSVSVLLLNLRYYSEIKKIEHIHVKPIQYLTAMAVARVLVVPPSFIMISASALPVDGENEVVLNV